MRGAHYNRSSFSTGAVTLFTIAALLGTPPLTTSAARQLPSRVVAQQEAKLDLSQTSVSFTLDATAHTVHGEFTVTRAEIHIADVAEGKLSGEIVVDARSGRTGNDSRDHRMHAEVLESKRYPEIVLRPSRLVHGQIGPETHLQAEVQGVVTIHGAEHEITVPVQVDCSNSRCTVVAEFTVPYVEWGMKNPSNFLLRVSKTVALKFHTVLQLGPTLTR